MLLRCLPALPRCAAPLLRTSLRCLRSSVACYAPPARQKFSPPPNTFLRCVHSTAAAAAGGRARSGGAVAPQAMGKNVYAVVAGRRPGLYTSWDQCLLQVKGYPGNRYKGFASEQEAVQYLREHGVAVPEAAGGLRAGQEQGQGAPPPIASRPGAAGGRSSAGAAGAGAAVSRKRRAASSSAPAKRRQQAAGAAAQPAAAAEATAEGHLQPTGRVMRLEFDGASKRNPGPAGFGAVLYDEATGVEVARLCQYMGDYHTNNQAEYAGLIAGLAAALELGCTRIKVQGDSTLIIRQVLGEWRVKNEGLQPYHAAATALCRRFSSLEAQQVLREFNKVADALSNQAIDDYRSGVNRQLWRLEEVVAAAAAMPAAGAAGGGGGAAAAAAAAGNAGG